MICEYFSVSSLFTLLVASFASRKLFSLMQSHLSVFAFLACSVVTFPWFHTCLDQCCKAFSPVFYSWNLAVWGSYFASLIHFELISVGWVRKVQFHSFISGCRFPSTIGEKTALSSPICILGTLVEDQLTHIHTQVYFWAFSSVPLVCVSICEKWKFLSHVRLFVTPRTIRPMEFYRPEYWSGSLSLLQGIFPTQGLNPGLSTLQADSLPAEPQAQEYWNGYSVPSPGDLPDPGRSRELNQELNQGLLHCRQILYQLSYQGRPDNYCTFIVSYYSFVI